HPPRPLPPVPTRRSSDLDATTAAPADEPPPNDTTASRQLRAKLTANDALQDVTASVDDGVAELEGTVLGPTHRTTAGEFATETPDRKSTRLNSSHVKTSY